MVSICAGANVYEPWAALVIGTMAGIIFLAVRQLMFKLQVEITVRLQIYTGKGCCLTADAYM